MNNPSTHCIQVYNAPRKWIKRKMLHITCASPPTVLFHFSGVISTAYYLPVVRYPVFVNTFSMLGCYTAITQPERRRRRRRQPFPERSSSFSPIQRGVSYFPRFSFSRPRPAAPTCTILIIIAALVFKVRILDLCALSWARKKSQLTWCINEQKLFSLRETSKKI